MRISYIVTCPSLIINAGGHNIQKTKCREITTGFEKWLSKCIL